MAFLFISICILDVFAVVFYRRLRCTMKMVSKAEVVLSVAFIFFYFKAGELH